MNIKKFWAIISKKIRIRKYNQKALECTVKGKVLGGVFPPLPSFVYKKAPNLRDILAPGVLDPPSKKIGTLTPFLTGFYTCGRCLAYRTTKGSNVKKKSEFIATATGRVNKIKDFITCSSEGVVYMLECSYKLQCVSTSIKLEKGGKNIVSLSTCS